MRTGCQCEKGGSMRVIIKHMNPPLWYSFATSLFVFFCFLMAYFFSDAGSTARITFATALAMQGIMFCVVWGLIIFSMHDREKREKEHERFLHEIKQEGERFKAEMKVLRNQRRSN